VTSQKVKMFAGIKFTTALDMFSSYNMSYMTTGGGVGIWPDLITILCFQLKRIIAFSMHHKMQNCMVEKQHGKNHWKQHLDMLVALNS